MYELPFVWNRFLQSIIKNTFNRIRPINHKDGNTTHTLEPEATKLQRTIQNIKSKNTRTFLTRSATSRANNNIIKLTFLQPNTKVFERNSH